MDTLNFATVTQCPLWVMIGHSRCKKSRPLYSPQSRYVRCTRSCLLWANSGHRPVPSLLGAGPPVCRLIDGERIHRQISDVNVKDHLVLAPDAANSMLLANVGFAAVQKPTFYRKRAQVAEGFAKRCRDETAKQMLQRVAERWRELARLAGSRKSSRASSKPKKRKPR